MILPPEAREINFGRQTVWLDPAATLYLPAQATLVVSDLHLAKGSALGLRGIPLPLYDSHDTLDRLEQVLGRYQPDRVILLGDSFHDQYAWQRLPQAEQTRIVTLVNQVSVWHWIAGNHDAHLDTLLPGQHSTTVEIGGLHFAHQPLDDIRPLVIGHFHPKLSRRIDGVKVKGKAFVYDQNLMILPAFGSYTGGLDLTESVFRSLIPLPRSLVIQRNRLWRVD